MTDDLRVAFATYALALKMIQAADSPQALLEAARMAQEA